MLSEDERDDLIADNNFQHGRDYERERIIVMLQQMNHECQCAIRGPERDRVIALIKGESK